MASNGTPTMTVQDNSGRVTILGPEVVRECRVLTEVATFADTSEVCKIQVDADLLDLVIEFSKIFKDEPEHTTLKGIAIDAPEWETSPAMHFFTRFDNNEILRLMNNVDYLEAQRLIDYAVFYICRQIQHLSDSEKLAFFGLPENNQPKEPYNAKWDF